MTARRIALGLWDGMPVDDLIGCVRLADRAGYETAFGDLIAAGDARAAASLITDEMAAGITVAGTAATCARPIDEYRARCIRLPIAYPIHPEFRGYLPDPASREGILRTVEALAGA